MFSEGDEFPIKFPITSLDFYYILSGQIEITPENQLPIKFLENSHIEPLELQKNGISKIKQIRPIGLCKALIISAEDYFFLHSVFLF